MPAGLRNACEALHRRVPHSRGSGRLTSEAAAGGGIVMPELAAAPELLPGEQCLWSGGPARARISLGDFGLSAYLLAALVLIAILAPSFVRHLPAFFIAIFAVVGGGVALQSLVS